MSNVTQFPTPEPVEFLYPYHEMDRVQIESRIIPRLTGSRRADGVVSLCIDGRFVVDFPAEVALSAAWLLAQALAVGAGYAWLGATSKDQPFAPKAIGLSELPEA